MTDDSSDHEDTPEALVASLVSLLELEPLEVDLFRGARTDEPWVRVFGGQVIGQALMAACRTVSADRPPHSLHAYFMRPGNPALPIVYQVARDRDGASFTSRRVTAIQDGRPILGLAASFQLVEEGLQHQSAMPDVPGPDDLADDLALSRARIEDIPERHRALMLRPRPIEFRPVEPDAFFGDHPARPVQHFWFRAVAPLPDDTIRHRVLLAYASDMVLLGASLLPHAVLGRGLQLQEASLDHALWIHEDFRLDEWMLYAVDSPWAGGGRGMNRGLIFTRDGRLVASVAQEGLIRVRS